MRSDEHRVPVHLGDSPPLIPLRKPFDLVPWQLVSAIVLVGTTLSLDSYINLSDEPFQEGSIASPMLLARVLLFMIGGTMILLQPEGRTIPGWILAALGHFYRSLGTGYIETGDTRVRSFDVEASAMTRMKLHGESTVFIVDPPLWGFWKHTWWAQAYWDRNVPYRMLLPVEPEGSIELMTDADRAGRWHGLASGIKALANPVEFVAQARAEDVQWFVDRALPPLGSPFASMRQAIEQWARVRAQKLIQRRIIVACSAADPEVLIEHTKDVVGALTDSGLVVRTVSIAEQRAIFDEAYGKRRFYPRDINSFGIDDIDWVTLVVRQFPSHVVVGWLMNVIGALPVQVALYAVPDDATWLTRVMDWFTAMCELPSHDTLHEEALKDLQYVEGKVKRNEDSVMRTTLLLSMPAAIVPRVKNRLRKAGALFRQATYEHQQGRIATLPVGGVPHVGATRPLDGESVAACYPFGASGLRMNGPLIGIARDSPEAVTLDIEDDSFFAAMIAILGVTGAGKTFLMQLLIERSGLPFTLIDMKLHLDEVHHGDFYRFLKACGGTYIVARPGEPIPQARGRAICYNLAALNDEQEQADALYQIAEWEWAQALDTLEPRIFATDEANLLGKHKAGKDFIERVATQGRSVGFIGMFASQMVGDFLADPQLRKAVKMSSMLFVLAQEHSEVHVVSQALDLGAAATLELSKFQPAPGEEAARHSRNAIMRAGRRTCSLSIEACPEEIALFTTKPADKRVMRAVAQGAGMAGDTGAGSAATVKELVRS